MSKVDLEKLRLGVSTITGKVMLFSPDNRTASTALKNTIVAGKKTDVTGQFLRCLIDFAYRDLEDASDVQFNIESENSEELHIVTVRKSTKADEEAKAKKKAEQDRKKKERQGRHRSV